MPNTNAGFITEQVELQRPKVLVGNCGTLLEKCLQQKEKFFIDEEVVNIVKPDEFIESEIPLISPSTGLLETPSTQDKQVMCKFLIDPNVKIGRLLSLESTIAKNLNGIYRVDTINYGGDYDGQDWSMETIMTKAEGYTAV